MMANNDTDELWLAIVRMVPDFQSVVDALGSAFLEQSRYLTVAALYDLAIEAFSEGRTDILRAIFSCVEWGLSPEHADLHDAFSIDFIEALLLQRQHAHFETFRRMLGPRACVDFESKE